MLAFYLSSAVLFTALAALAWIDARTGYLPDRITLPLIAGGLIVQPILGFSLLSAAIGAALGYGAFLLLEKGYLRVRGHAGLGRGDAKLLAAGGAWCGALSLPFMGVLTGLGGLSFALLLKLFGREITRHSVIRLGPFLALAIMACWLLRFYVGPQLGLSLN